MKTLGFWSGLRVSIQAFSLVMSQASLRAWFLKSIIVTWVIAIGVFLTALSLGAWGLWSQYGQNWKAGLGAAGMVVIFCFIAGTITSSINNILVMLVAGEKRLLRAMTGTELLALLKVPFAVKKNEIKKILITVLCSLFCWPLLLLPITTPVGILLYAWAMGAEAQATGEKMYLQLRGDSLPPVQKGGLRFSIGLAFIPAILGIFPFIGWTLLPSLPIAGYLARQKMREPLKA